MSEKSLVRTRLTQGVLANIVGRPVQLVIELAASVLVARFLGPGLLATLVAIRALAGVANAVGDFGLTGSISKIVPDLSAHHGPREALRAVQKLTLLRLVAVPLVGLAGFALTRFGWIDIGDIELSWMMAAAGISLGTLQMVNGSRRYVILAALRLRDILVLDVLASLFGPTANLAAAILTRDPLVVALTSLASEALVCLALHLWLGYDLDAADSRAGAAVSLRALVRRYGTFIAMSYAKFVFNRVVLRNPMLLVILGLLGASTTEIGNAAISLSLAFQAWEVANIPLAQMRAPLLARFHARQDRAGLEKLEAASVSIVTMSSCLLAVAAMAGAEPLVATVYGPAYADAARWTAIACATGLLANVVSLGNNTLQQLENYRPQVLAMVAALACIATGLILLLRSGLSIEPALAALLLIVLTRAVFWLITDLQADRLVFGWAHSATKLRGVLAALPALALGAWLDADTLAGGLIGAAAMALLFLALFRAIGGIGAPARELLRGALPARLAPLVALI
jgi:O-antigen/teichoic acid export membrane protein